ncbi:hypothetical protein V6L77_23845 [Pannonibacter sp. Pt2-lr]
MKNTHFANPTGYPAPGAKVTARDLSLLAGYILVSTRTGTVCSASRSSPGTISSSVRRTRFWAMSPALTGWEQGRANRAGSAVLSLWSGTGGV